VDDSLSNLAVDLREPESTGGARELDEQALAMRQRLAEHWVLMESQRS
jgi:hypothetical protein